MEELPAAPTLETEPTTSSERTIEPAVTGEGAHEGPLPDWLKEIEEAPSTPSAEPSLTSILESELPEWQEQKAEVETPLTTEVAPQELPAAEVEPSKTGPLPEEPPIWLVKGAEEAGEIPTVTVPQTAPMEEELPDWMKEIEGISEAALEPAAPTHGTEELPDWLKEEEPELPQAQQPAAELPEWLQGVEAEQAAATVSSPTPVPYEEENMIWLNEELPRTAKPGAGAGVAEPAEPIPAWMQEPEAMAEELPTMGGPRPEPETIPEAAISALPLEPVAAISPIKDQAKANQILSDSQAALTEGQIAAAIQGYSQLISANINIEEAVHDLRDALYRFPVDISIWQTLGDAYVRSNRLQDGLDAYTKAEELLR